MASNRELANIQHKAIQRANQAANPFSKIADVYENYKKDDLDITIKFYSSKDMTKDLQKFCFKLVERNVGGYYKTCSYGWQPKIKQNDMAKKWGRFLVAYEDRKPIGFCQFRFDMDYGRSVIYCYELQIDDAHQNKGLGEHLMKALETLAKVYELERVVLTLLTNNEGAARFYRNRLGYMLDEMSPDKSEETAYEILSKEIS